jgi:hypothetical protein
MELKTDALERHAPEGNTADSCDDGDSDCDEPLCGVDGIEVHD